MRNTLPWHIDWFSDLDFTDLKILINEGLISSYASLYDIKGSYVSQTEKTIGIFESGIKIYN